MPTWSSRLMKAESCCTIQVTGGDLQHGRTNHNVRRKQRSSKDPLTAGSKQCTPDCTLQYYTCFNILSVQAYNGTRVVLAISNTISSISRRSLAELVAPPRQAARWIWMPGQPQSWWKPWWKPCLSPGGFEPELNRSWTGCTILPDALYFNSGASSALP